ncbi:hypothetical protein KM043_002345 [Ampulex compressa]|nr:hypothetical protein KM043_002345 [Ampulex compressa]
MEGLGALMIEGEDYEVVDECMEEEDTPNPAPSKPAEGSIDEAQSTSVETMSVNEVPDKIQHEQPKDADASVNTSKNAIDIDLCSNDNQILTPEEKNTTDPTMKEDSTDFTADISLDQLDDEKQVADNNILHNFKDTENIILDGNVETQGQKDVPDQGESNTTSKEEKNEIAVIEQKSDDTEKTSEQSAPTTSIEKNDWYEKKLSEKEATIRERMSKLARVLGFSYPGYEKWLEKVEKTEGSPVCKLEPARRCCLDKPYTNRWKFICSRKSVQESAKEADDTDASQNKKLETVWRLEATGSWGFNTNNESEFPPFVLRAVKIFENFLQTTDQQAQETIVKTDGSANDAPSDAEQKKVKQQWLWLLVRCNSMDELMLFATGKNISRNTMDLLKQVFESGPGKECNVKSLYCKSVNTSGDTIVTNTTFLLGSEALDEIVGGLKIQLAPKTNFWSNVAGAENVAKAVIDLLAPSPKTTVLEVGCGIGLIGLMMASKCQHVIGIDSPSEVEEAEMTCELNNIKNASFIMGSATEVINTIVAAVKNTKTYAIINANTNIGRAIELMTCLTKINSLKRIAMITTLTKHSVRAILELVRPVDPSHGLSFIPTLACVVDTLPVGPHFEVVILMERRLAYRTVQPWILKTLDEEGNPVDGNASQENSQSSNADEKVTVKASQSKVNQMKTGMKASPIKKVKPMAAKKGLAAKNTDGSMSKDKFKGKRAHSPDKSEVTPKKMVKKFNKFQPKPWRPEGPQKKKKDWNEEKPRVWPNPMYEKKIRESKNQGDLRERLSNNRVDIDIVQKVKEHQAMLEIAKDKLSGPAPIIDVQTAKQLQSMLNMVLEQTNKLQNQLPRSVWDRIAPVEGGERSNSKEELQDDLLRKGRFVQEMGTQDILITTANRTFMDNEPQQKPIYRKYNNLAPLEPNTALPTDWSPPKQMENVPKLPERYQEFRQAEPPGNTWNKGFEQPPRWGEFSGPRKPVSPPRKAPSPMKHRLSPPRRFSPKRPLLSPPRQTCSPPRKHVSLLRRPMSPFRQHVSPPRRPLSPMRRPSPPMRRPMSPPRRPISPMGRPISPPRRPMATHERPMTHDRPMSTHDRPMSTHDRPMATHDRPMATHDRPMATHDRPMATHDRSMATHERPMSTHERQMSTHDRQMSTHDRPISPLKRYVDDWDIPSRSAVEQSTWQRPGERISPEGVWRNDRIVIASGKWEQPSSTDRYHKDKWEPKDSQQSEGTWKSGAETWRGKQQTSAKPVAKEGGGWLPSSENRWTSVSGNDSWNIRPKESFSGREDSWMEKKTQRWEPPQGKDSWVQGDKDDWNDLPEDAKDPWGDDGNLGLKERWLKFDGTSSGWSRDADQQGDSWSKPKEGWQSKNQGVGQKPQWQSNTGQGMGKSRWLSEADMPKKPAATGWQTGNSSGSWQPQNFNFQQQRRFGTNQFKNRR